MCNVKLPAPTPSTPDPSPRPHGTQRRRPGSPLPPQARIHWYDQGSTEHYRAAFLQHALVRVTSLLQATCTLPPTPVRRRSSYRALLCLPLPSPRGHGSASSPDTHPPRIVIDGRPCRLPARTPASRSSGTPGSHAKRRLQRMSFPPCRTSPRLTTSTAAHQSSNGKNNTARYSRVYGTGSHYSSGSSR